MNTTATTDQQSFNDSPNPIGKPKILPQWTHRARRPATCGKRAGSGGLADSALAFALACATLAANNASAAENDAPAPPPAAGRGGGFGGGFSASYKIALLINGKPVANGDLKNVAYAGGPGGGGGLSIGSNKGTPVSQDYTGANPFNGEVSEVTFDATPLEAGETP